MKTIVLSTILILFALLAGAQEWHTDLDKAKDLAKENNQHIVLVFSGSDWCAPCIKLENEIWSSAEFKTQAKNQFVLVKADFPRRKKNKLSDAQQENNNALAEKYNTQGLFPFVVVLNYKGEVLGSTGYKKVSPSEYVQTLASF